MLCLLIVKATKIHLVLQHDHKRTTYSSMLLNSKKSHKSILAIYIFKWNLRDRISLIVSFVLRAWRHLQHVSSHTGSNIALQTASAIKDQSIYDITLSISSSLLCRSCRRGSVCRRVKTIKWRNSLSGWVVRKMRKKDQFTAAPEIEVKHHKQPCHIYISDDVILRIPIIIHYGILIPWISECAAGVSHAEWFLLKHIFCLITN